MKLVDILARELKVWPANDCGYDYCVQSYNERNVIFGGISNEMAVSEIAEDNENAQVTRAQWQAVVDALKAENCAHLWVGWSDTEACELCNKTRKIVVEWNGDGLPPVGIDVEVFPGYSHPRFDRFIGQQVHIVAHDAINGDPVAVFRMPIDGDEAEQDYHAMVASSFRPIRTPEQIAADEKQRAVAEMEAQIAKWGLTSDYNGMCQALYDAGYRKFEIVDN